MREATAMSRLPQIDPENATGKAATQLTETQKALGSVPNLMKVLVNSPAAVKGYLAMNGALAAGVLPFPVRERISILAAELNGCTYCLSAHTFSGGKFAKLSDSELAAAREAKSQDAHIEAILTLTRRVIEGRGQGGEQAIAEARTAGVTDEEIAEVVANVAVNVLTNYFNELVDTDVDFPRVAPHAH
ncbi:carboxymuconolactone decarboxylase family protein [Streptomyces montanisoli]|uniref:Carboxymuconolactone decarboxylase family protein n=1 Tax=Streptomyces montanisoli TaxID=2798581 RepID=A0A940MIJ7_9ACTN|nr:carboxymuconolactone decarboxylase family protein [Streptomyces montanisoli]MBP0459916.1 carboxymuconolactone decarboxylase family protein [Streptomyces montanisoli]